MQEQGKGLAHELFSLSCLIHVSDQFVSPTEREFGSLGCRFLSVLVCMGMYVSLSLFSPLLLLQMYETWIPFRNRSSH